MTAIADPATAPRKVTGPTSGNGRRVRRYTADQVPIGSLLLRMLAGLVVLRWCSCCRT